MLELSSDVSTGMWRSQRTRTAAAWYPPTRLHHAATSAHVVMDCHTQLACPPQGGVPFPDSIAAMLVFGGCGPSMQYVVVWSGCVLRSLQSSHV